MHNVKLLQVATMGAAKTIPTIANMAFRYRAGPTWCFSDVNGLVPCADGDRIQYLRDTSGNARHLLQTTLAARPQLVFVGGVWVVRGDGARTMEWQGTTFSNTTGLTVGVVYDPPGDATQNDLLMLRDLGLGNTLTMIRAGTVKARFNYTTSASANIDSVANWNSARSAFVMSVAANLAFRHKVEGVLMTGTLAGTAVTRDIGLIQLGNAFGELFDSDIYEVVGYTGSPSDNDFEALYQYLAP
jgi:hypothetical protein